MADYFPARVIKTTELEPGEKYVIAIYPHAVFPLSIFLYFMTSLARKVFPGIHFCPIPHHKLFYVPVLGELLYLFGRLDFLPISYKVESNSKLFLA